MILGLDFSGVVAAVASSVTGFQVADECLARCGLMGGLPSRDGFHAIVRWLEEGRLAAEVWKTFDLEHIREAHAASQTGAAVGKIAVVVR